MAIDGSNVAPLISPADKILHVDHSGCGRPVRIWAFGSTMFCCRQLTPAFSARLRHNFPATIERKVRVVHRGKLAEVSSVTIRQSSTRDEQGRLHQDREDARIPMCSPRWITPSGITNVADGWQTFALAGGQSCASIVDDVYGSIGQPHIFLISGDP